MKTTIFPVTLRKYHVSFPEEMKDSIYQLYNKYKFQVERPFVLQDEGVESLIQYYVDTIEEFVDEVSPGASATVTSVSLNVLCDGDHLPREAYLPGHYSAVHYISYDESRHSPDVYCHPARSVLSCVRPQVDTDEFDLAKGIWVQEGDLVIYPSYIETFSPINTSKEERITLMFTFVVTANEHSRESSSEKSSE